MMNPPELFHGSPPLHHHEGAAVGARTKSFKAEQLPSVKWTNTLDWRGPFKAKLLLNAYLENEEHWRRRIPSYVFVYH